MSTNNSENDCSGSTAPHQLETFTDFALIGKQELILDLVKEEPPEYPDPDTQENFIILSNEAAIRDPFCSGTVKDAGEKVVLRLQQTSGDQTLPVACHTDYRKSTGLLFLDHTHALIKEKPQRKCGSSQCGAQFEYKSDLYCQHKTTHEPKITANSGTSEQSVDPSKKVYADTDPKTRCNTIISAVKEDNNPKNTRVKSHQCLLCSKVYYTAGHLTNHLQRAHSDPSFICELCGKKFRDKGDLRLHKTIHSSEKPFECGICSAKFKVRSYLWSHRYTHTTEKNFKCDMCSAAFVRPTCLQRHVTIVHATERKFPCTYCSKKFARINELKEHLVIHSDAKPFVCDVCGKGHKRARSLRDHVKSKHSVVQLQIKDINC